MSYLKVLSKIKWSFSTLHMYEQCPFAFYLKKIEGEDEEQNFYAENGTAMHEILADILKKNITVDDAPNAYIDSYELMCAETKQSTMDKVFNTCVDYLCEVQPPPDNIEVIGVEMQLDFKIDRYCFIGYADAVLRNKDTNEVWLVDHKSSTHFLKKNGEPLKAQLDNFNAYKHQMYLYCYGLREQFGISIDHICWHHFRENGALTIIPFKEEELEETKTWAIDIIEQIRKDKKFEPQRSYMMCQSLCGYKEDCDYTLFEEEDED